MHVGVVHTITDRAAWDRITGELDLSTLPSGVVLLCTVTAADVSKAICIWEAPGVDQLQRMLDETLGDAAVNDCFATDPERSMGVPETAVAQA